MRRGWSWGPLWREPPSASRDDRPSHRWQRLRAPRREGRTERSWRVGSYEASRRKTEGGACVRELGVGLDARDLGPKEVLLGLDDVELRGGTDRVAIARELGREARRRYLRARGAPAFDVRVDLLPRLK